jgi:hypothetical protein
MASFLFFFLFHYSNNQDNELKKKRARFRTVYDGMFTDKVKGKAPSKQRPEFDESKYDLQDRGKTNPPRDLCCSGLQRPENAKHFIRPRGQPTGKKRRNTIFDILSLQ